MNDFGVGMRGVVPQLIVTFSHSGLTKEHHGKPVKLAANETVALAADGEPMHGTCETVTEDIAGIKLTGCWELPFTGTAPVLGWNLLSANGAGGVKVDVNGDSFLVSGVDAATVRFARL